MSTCLVCDEETINLFKIYQPKNNKNSINEFVYQINYENKKEISYLNYCNRCFHCQMENDENEEIQNEEIQYEEIQNEEISISIKKGDKTTEEIDKIINRIEDAVNYNNILFITEYELNRYKNNISIKEFLNYEIQDKFDKIIIYKCFDKTYYIKSVFEKCSKILNKGGEIIIVTSTENVIIDKKYHLLNNNIKSLFSTNSMKMMCEKYGLTVLYIEKNAEYSIYSIGNKRRDEIGSSNDLIRNLYKDIENNIYDDKIYIMFNLYGLLLKSKIQKKLLKLNINRFENDLPNYIIGYGLDETSINLINFCELTSEYIDYFLSFELESGCNVPGTDIKIKNYWNLIGRNEVILGNLIIVNFNKTHVNDKTLEFFSNLFSGDIRIIDIMINVNANV